MNRGKPANKQSPRQRLKQLAEEGVWLEGQRAEENGKKGTCRQKK